MKIALVTSSFLPNIGGAEFVVHYLGLNWTRQGHEVMVVNFISDRNTQPDAEYSIVKYKVLRGTTRWGGHRFPFCWYAARNIGRHLDKFKPDFISAHFGYPLAFWMSKIKTGCKYIITCHGTELDETPRGPRQRLGIDGPLAAALNKSSGVVAISRHARKIMEKIGVDPGLTIDIPNGADTERFGRQSRFNLRDHFKIPTASKVILGVGRENWAKAYDMGIKALARVMARYPEVYYVILGRGVEAKWGGLARELGVADRMIFCEGLYGSELIGAYQQADIFFMCSVKELCPLVVPEAMAAGLPTVVTDVSGCQDLVKTGENGYVIPPGDYEQMGEALLELLGNEALREKYGAANLDRSKNYSWDRISREYLKYA